MFGNAPKPLWERWFRPDSHNRISLACRALLIELDDIKVLCETGIGAFMEPAQASRYGVQDPDEHKLLEGLGRLGVSHEEIDYVVLSHLHFDHAGGLLPTFSEIQSGNDGLLFPQARYITSKEAFARAEKPHLRDKASFIPGLVEKLKASQRLILNDQSKIDGFFEEHIRFVFSDGHTPGQMHAVVRGEKDNVIFCGDLIPGTSWLHLPITMGYDRFPERLIDEKTNLFESAKDNWLFFYTHDPEYACSRVVFGEKGKYEAQDPAPQLIRRKI